jgi:hypothetical protein
MKSVAPGSRYVREETGVVRSKKRKEREFLRIALPSDNG